MHTVDLPTRARSIAQAATTTAALLIDFNLCAPLVIHENGLSACCVRAYAWDCLRTLHQRKLRPQQLHSLIDLQSLRTARIRKRAFGSSRPRSWTARAGLMGTAADRVTCMHAITRTFLRTQRVRSD
jgi:hypothetical protein